MRTHASGTWVDGGRRAHGFTAAMTAEVAVGASGAAFNRFDATMPRFYHRRLMGTAPQQSTAIILTAPSLAAGEG